MKENTIYLDNGATTKIDSKIKRYLTKDYGNASSIHNVGINAKNELNKAREIIANSLNANPKEIIFTSGGTESNNMVLKGIAFANKDKGNHIIVSKIEHDCVLNSCKWLETQGFKISYLGVDEFGFINEDTLKNTITKDTILVSIIHGNNEIGTIQNLVKLYSICKNNNIYFHTDACQSYTKTELNSNHADLITINSHKIHGPKGIGALYIKKGTKITPLQHGGGHEFNLRSGTENINNIVAFSKIVKLAQKNKQKNIKKMTKLRDYFIDNILKIENTILNGPKGKNRLCNNINVSFMKVEGESILFSLDLVGICASTGSACSSKSLDPSHVIMALEKNHERAHGSIRFTISKYTTKKEIDYTLTNLKQIIKRLRDLSPLGD
jgi:cysteine desulfurase